MESRTIGRLTVSVVGIGCNNFGGRTEEAATRAVVAAALDEGITLFDTADIYGGTRSEELLGAALGPRRDDVVIATKFGMGDGAKLPAGASAASIASAVEGSLRRLGTDRIDLYQLHAPDDATPIDETLAALDRLVNDGKVLEIGCSNFDGARLDDAAASAEKHATAPFVSVQNELSLLRRRGESDLRSACERHQLAILPYFPLASGMLTGNTLLELAMSWLAGIPHLASVIAGATKPEQVRANAAAVGWLLTDEDRTDLDRISPER